MSPTDGNYPQWVQREPWVGAVLCLTADEHDALLSEWAEHLGLAEAERVATIKAQAKAEEAERLALQAELEHARPTRKGK